MFRYPVNYIAITQYFKSGVHNGLDLGWNSNYYGKEQPIYASASGTIIELKNDYTTTDSTGSSYGNYVKIKHDNNLFTLYAHLKTNSIPYKIGDTVKQGTQIGIMGNTGRSNGNHLHFEIFEGTTKVNPLNLTYVYSDQIISKNLDATEGLLYYIPETPKADKELQELQDKINLQLKEIESLKNEINELKQNKFEYTITKTSLYKINLYEGEILIVK
mgnify:FL=1